MKINSKNKQAIHDVLITDLQRRLFKQYNARTNEFITSSLPNSTFTDEDYDEQQTLLVDRILHLDTISDVNDVLIEYGDLFMDYDSINVFTLDGTMNYLFKLLKNGFHN